MQTAELLRCTPWELLRQPQIWQEWAITKANAEAAYREYLATRPPG